MATNDGSASSLLPPTRLEAFSDAVFAIAITLLVLELEVPDGATSLLEHLGQEWPSYLGYFVSFASIGGVWIAHSTLTRFTKATDQVLLGLNLVLLLLVSFLPFTTNVLADHLSDVGEHVAVVVFGINLTLTSVMVNAMFGYVARTEGLADPASEQELRDFGRERRIAVVIQAVATVVGFILPTAAVLTYLAISLLLVVDPIWQAQRAKRRAQKGR